MLTRIDLEHFKCFETLRLPLAQLTLLSGTNASGKSSVLQALGLISQTLLEQEWSSRLLFNGRHLSLGTIADVVDQLTSARVFSIGIEGEERFVQWELEGDRHEMSARVARVKAAGAEEVPPLLRHLLPASSADDRDIELMIRLRDLTYLSAERVGPREIYPLVDPQLPRTVGCRGENALSVLYWGADEVVASPLTLPESLPTRFHQVERWMYQFFPGCAIALSSITGMNAVTLGIRTSPSTNFLRPTNVGFGLTQVLPIVIAALSARPDDLLFIENPEVHLHPSGQARMGMFLATAAKAGVQIVLETHSDHVLNGIRRAVKSGIIPADHVALHFFTERNSGRSQVISPTVDDNGLLDVEVDGFFDQFDKDANYFAGWGK